MKEERTARNTMWTCECLGTIKGSKDVHHLPLCLKYRVPVMVLDEDGRHLLGSTRARMNSVPPLQLGVRRCTMSRGVAC